MDKDLEHVVDFLEETSVRVPKSALAEAYAQVLRLSGIGLTGLIASAVERSATHVAEQYLQAYGKPEAVHVPEMIALFLTRGGWGTFQVRQQQDRMVELEAPEGTLFTQHGIQSRKPVCHPISASIQGFARKLLGERARVKEVQCRAKQDERCVFRVEW